MKIRGIENMDGSTIQREVEQGGKFVVYTYCISIVFMTFKRSSDIYFIPSRESAVSKGLPFTLLSAVVGWWGIPWGPIYTTGALISNLRGGTNVTREVMSSLSSEVA